MNISTVPQEMLANILKYTNYKDIYKMRRLSCFVNETVKRYSELKRIPIRVFEYSESAGQSDESAWNVNLHFHPAVLKCFNTSEEAGLEVLFENKSIEKRKEKLSELAKKVKLDGMFLLKRSVLDDSLLSAIETFKRPFKHCTFLFLSTVHLTILPEKMKLLLDMMPNVKSITYFIVESEVYGSERLFKSEVLGKRKWDLIRFHSVAEPVDRPYLNDQFLLEVAPNCQSFCIETIDNTFFTFQGVVRMIKEVLSGGQWNRYVRLGTILLGTTKLSAVGGILNLLNTNYTCLDKDSVDGWKAHYKNVLLSVRLNSTAQDQGRLEDVNNARQKMPFARKQTNVVWVLNAYDKYEEIHLLYLPSL